jgi:hypothetical protein
LAPAKSSSSGAATTRRSPANISAVSIGLTATRKVRPLASTKSVLPMSIALARIARMSGSVTPAVPLLRSFLAAIIRFIIMRSE